MGQKSDPANSKAFDIDLNKIPVGENQNIWHIGRFAISRKIPNSRIGILKKMLFNAFYPAYYFQNGIILAECDRKAIISLQKMGIQSVILGNSIEYISSETSPIYIKSSWLSSFISISINRYFSIDNFKSLDFFNQKYDILGYNF